MSGPIVRKYGFPNFDKIFGEKPIQHGADEATAPKPEQPLEGEKPDDLVPDLSRGDQPADAEAASEHNQMAPATEFGQTSD